MPPTNNNTTIDAGEPTSEDQLTHIRRSSLALDPAWDAETNSLRHLGDLDDDDLIPIAYFPLKANLNEAPKTKQEGLHPSASAGDVSAYSQGSSDDIWQNVPMGAPDAILGIAQAYRQCEDPRKVNVCVGAYRDDAGKSYVLPSVRAAEKMLWESQEPKEYLPIEGDKDFVRCALKFAYGPNMDIDTHVAAVQTLSGTGACAIGGRFLAQFWKNHPIYVPDPTWSNHISIFNQCGLDCRKYRYYNRSTNALDLEGMLKDLNRAKDGSIFLLHACAHNPTGCDPSLEQWKEVIDVVRQKHHVCFFDSAYQGFASGNAEVDAQAFRYAVSQHVPILLAQSFAKNFGLYGERVGTLSVVCGDAEQRDHILSELRLIIRPLYSSPPRHGSSIVKTVLMDPALKEQYYEECAGMALRIQKMRVKLVQALQKAGSQHDWSHITGQIGMFAFTGMNEAMCQQLTDEFSIYLTMNGRISMAGLNQKNLEYVAASIHVVTDGKSISL
ncbi:unnamed protein product [Cylindrotheca closterium]|uniref:Aspartate aminotransferase n=1 Tax=Cylindrotheca closterium TaxID=2856 RepID=A0AAD2FXQ1_9STRA|nr:unnamed protein product [Cylindrotheca closterium]